MVLKSFRSPFRTATDRRRSRTSFYNRTPRSASKFSQKGSHIKVCVRVRPETAIEAASSASRNVVAIMDRTVLVFDPPEVRQPTYFKGSLIRDPTARRCKDIQFAFDHIFSSESQNTEVFENTTKPIMEKFLGGYNCSVFAYGSTGSGKTHTMLGKTGKEGIMQLTMKELFDRLRHLKDDYNSELSICYFEVYNETVRDLLKPENGLLSIRENGLSSVTINNLSFHQLSSPEEVSALLNKGNQNRTQHPTDANKESSRSHAVFQIYLKQRPKTADVTTEVISSKMSLIDLAGSERATATKNCGERFREGANINRSLLSLGNCINALACGRKGAHVPYRDSKLTRILKDSLGGSCYTVMIANVSPSSFHYEDTFNTLKYADRAKQIKTDAKKNTFRFDEHIHRYAAIIEELRQENDHLKLRLASAEEKLTDYATPEMRRSCAALKKMKEVVFPLLDEYTKKKTQLMSLQSEEKLLNYKMVNYERSEEMVKFLTFDTNSFERSVQKAQKAKTKLETKLMKVSSEISAMSFTVDQLSGKLQTALAALAADAGDQGEETAVRFLLQLLTGAICSCYSRAEANHFRTLWTVCDQRMQYQEEAFHILGELSGAPLKLYDGLNDLHNAKLEKLVRLLNQEKQVCFDSDPSVSRSTASFELEDRGQFLSLFSNGSVDDEVFCPDRQTVRRSLLQSFPKSCVNGANLESSSPSSLPTANGTIRGQADPHVQNSECCHAGVGAVMNETFIMSDTVRSEPSRGAVPAVLPAKSRSSIVVNPKGVSPSNGVYSEAKTLASTSKGAFGGAASLNEPNRVPKAALSRAVAAVNDDTLFKKPFLPPRKRDKPTSNVTLPRQPVVNPSYKSPTLHRSPSFSGLNPSQMLLPGRFGRSASSNNLRRIS